MCTTCALWPISTWHDPAPTATAEPEQRTKRHRPDPPGRRRRTQKPVGETPCGFESRSRHQDAFSGTRSVSKTDGACPRRSDDGAGDRALDPGQALGHVAVALQLAD